jgi:hypothetical protein
MRCAEPGPGQQLQDPEPRDAVPRVLDETQNRQQIFDVGGFQEFEAAELDEWDVAPGQLDFERAAVVRRAEQHRLLLQPGAGLAVFEDALDDVSRLIRFVAYRHELQPLAAIAVGPQILHEALAGEPDQAVGRGEDRLRRAVVPRERHDLGGRAELAGKIEDVAHRRAAKRIDRLRIVADDGETRAVGLQRQQNRGLQAVGVLIFVDEDMIEAAADLGGEVPVGHHLRPVEDQIIVIENPLPLLRFDIGGEELLQRIGPFAAPRE